MTWSTFGKGLTLITLSFVLWMSGIAYSTGDFISFYMYAIAVFFYLLFSIWIFAFAKKMIALNRAFSFNGVISMSFLVKLILSVGIVWMIEYQYHPVGNTHILHYLIVYLVYTIYEVYFLTKLGRG